VQSSANKLNQSGDRRLKEEVRKIPLKDFRQLTILVEITAIILQPSRWLPASFYRYTPFRMRAIPAELRFSGKGRV
jgi:hypothetical protein